jgi:hypothetical protein
LPFRSPEYSRDEGGEPAAVQAVKEKLAEDGKFSILEFRSGGITYEPLNGLAFSRVQKLR